MTPVLAASSVLFGYDHAVPLLDDWSASFLRNEVVAITGPSGRGKSTLLYILGLMLKPAAGSIAFMGEDASGLSDSQRAQLRAHHFGFVFQDAVLDPTRTVLDNVTESSVYRGEDRRAAVPRALELLEQMEVSVRATAKPGEVSGGQAQRIALCRSLLSFPDIVLADEPTGNLDPDSSNVVLNALRSHAETGASVVIVSHDPEVVGRCERRIVL